MNRRKFLKAIAAFSGSTALNACGSFIHRDGATNGKVMTVNGYIDASEMGMTLTHEHVFADVRPFKEQLKNPLTPDTQEVVDIVLPNLVRIRDLGCKTLVECTATGLGRNPALIRKLSNESGLHMLTVTGNYGSAEEQFLPAKFYTDSVEARAERWINEWEKGIDGTGIKPGLIKIAFGSGPLTDVELKLIRAAAICHRETGLTIGSHTGVWQDVSPGENAVSAFEQLDELKAAGVSPSAWIWIHAHNEPDADQRLRAAREGAWVSMDGFRSDNLDYYVETIKQFRNNYLLDRLLLSQDAGWYTLGEPKGGGFNPYHPIFTTLIPALQRSGVTQEDINTLFVSNPAAAFSVGVRTTNM